ncbi:Rox3-domain-containing protein [Macroventuria anomochaeta]|uniref:Rox3-domain-containing protein n=1 Tax=Macroventuria anomochaeta TaxID=301207 RepID=A0ACB6SDJ4_9PLEO|nr:Rox3-domain-containing protein [Macroventuria anomochaeta]KAF2632216.1 Rox3-domain-containing protein [Macroventuria anomochaeta]
MSDHSAKRQRLDNSGRYSPASPPFDVAAKASGQTTKPIQPRTPTSPPCSSMNSQLNGRSAMTATAASPGKTPPSSATMSQSVSQPATSAAAQHPFLTPASTTGHSYSTNIDSDGDAMMEDGSEETARGLGINTHSNHDRQGQALFSEKGGLKAAEGISGSLLFLSSEETYEQSRPHGSQNLFRLYGLERLAKSVARVDPVTGEKINKLRKSYEGHIKTLQIAGKPKAVKMDDVFSGPVGLPDDHWDAINAGKEPWRKMNAEQTALEPDFSSLLDSAFGGMGPGALPPSDASKYKAYIGTDDTLRAKPAADTQARTPLPSSAPTPNSHALPRRPERSGSKRQYNEDSYQGYSEGYGDDFATDSTGEDGARGSFKRRKTQFERTAHSVEVGGARR